MIVEGWDVSLAYEIAASPDHGPDPGFLSDFFYRVTLCVGAVLGNVVILFTVFTEATRANDDTDNNNNRCTYNAHIVEP